MASNDQKQLTPNEAVEGADKWFVVTVKGRHIDVVMHNFSEAFGVAAVCKFIWQDVLEANVDSLAESRPDVKYGQ